MTSSWVDADAMIVAEPAVLTRMVDSHLVMYNPANDEISYLDPVGAVVWELIKRPQPLGELSAQLAESFDMEHPTIITDISRLLSRLVSSNLADLRVVSASEQLGE